MRKHQLSVEGSSDLFDKAGNPWVSEKDRRLSLPVVSVRPRQVEGEELSGNSFDVLKELTRRDILQSKLDRHRRTYRSEHTDPELDQFTKASHVRDSREPRQLANPNFTPTIVVSQRLASLALKKAQETLRVRRLK